MSTINLCWQVPTLAMDNPNPMGKIVADHEDCHLQRQLLLIKQRIGEDTSSENLAVEALVVDQGMQPLLAIEPLNNSPSSNFTESAVYTTGNNPFEWVPTEIYYQIFQFLDSHSAKQAALTCHAFNDLEKLTRRQLKVNTLITNEKLIEIAAKYLNLTSLDLAGCRQITDAALIKVAESCPNLT
ncbi:F-box/LRR-repeat protein [Candidatus Paracaedibacter symbiosus]|uniref:F-box/LRR-repeat protein n=1 Tax=Candidatus Paracaedibacter symbiosus TaxID=244582 RepID=UPI0005094024|nr:F-box/LRR-repeat protein [Candidatus Paracaedibacter symbiosus]